MLDLKKKFLQIKQFHAASAQSREHGSMVYILWSNFGTRQSFTYIANMLVPDVKIIIFNWSPDVENGIFNNIYITNYNEQTAYS